MGAGDAWGGSGPWLYIAGRREEMRTAAVASLAMHWSSGAMWLAGSSVEQLLGGVGGLRRGLGSSGGLGEKTTTVVTSRTGAELVATRRGIN